MPEVCPDDRPMPEWERQAALERLARVVGHLLAVDFLRRVSEAEKEGNKTAAA